MVFAGTSLWLWLGEPAVADFTGQATVKAVPDQFVFRPNYQATNDDPAAATDEVSAVGNAVVDKLIELGVSREDIKVQVYTNQTYVRDTVLPEPAPEPTGNQATYSLTATVREVILAQTVLDYLATTATIAGVTPESTFSDEKRKELESVARVQALEDARGKAESSAEALGAKLGRLVTVSDSSWGGPIPLLSRDAAVSSEVASEPAFTAPYLLTGEQEVSYFVTVQYELRG